MDVKIRKRNASYHLTQQAYDIKMMSFELYVATSKHISCVLVTSPETNTNGFLFHFLFLVTFEFDSFFV